MSARRLLPTTCLLVFLAGGTACEDESSPYREFASKAYGYARCDSNDGVLNLRRQIRVFANPRIEGDATARALANYYARHGLRFFSNHPVEVTDMAYVSDLDSRAMSAKLQKDFPGVDLSDEGLTALHRNDPAKFNLVARAVMSFQFSGLIDFIRRYDARGADVTNVVVLSNLFTPGTDKNTREGVLGIALSPFLFTELRRTGMDAMQVFSQLDVPPDFSPVVFIGNGLVSRFEQAFGALHRDLVAAHEFGHSAGLVHRMDDTNLMNPSTSGTESCTMGLTADQLQVMRKGLGLDPITTSTQGLTDASKGEGAGVVDRMPELTPSFVARLLAGDSDAQAELLAPFHHRH